MMNETNYPPHNFHGGRITLSPPIRMIRRGAKREQPMPLESSRRGEGVGGEVGVKVGVAERAGSLVIGPPEKAGEAIGVEAGGDDGGAVGGDVGEADWAGPAFDCA